MRPTYNSKIMVISFLILAAILLIVSHSVDNLAIKTTVVIAQLIISIYCLFHVCTVYFKQRLSLQKSRPPEPLPPPENH